MKYQVKITTHLGIGLYRWIYVLRHHIVLHRPIIDHDKVTKKVRRVNIRSLPGMKVGLDVINLLK